jgi:hypothetical protein
VVGRRRKLDEVPGVQRVGDHRCREATDPEPPVPETPADLPMSLAIGTAGGSAQRQYQKRHQRREQKIEQKGGRFASVVKLLSEDPQNITAWAKVRG